MFVAPEIRLTLSADELVKLYEKPSNDKDALDRSVLMHLLAQRSDKAAVKAVKNAQKEAEKAAKKK